MLVHAWQRHEARRDSDTPVASSNAADSRQAPLAYIGGPCKTRVNMAAWAHEDHFPLTGGEGQGHRYIYMNI